VKLTVALCHSKCTYEDLLYIPMCSDPPPMNCNTGFGKMHSTIFSAALQNRLTVTLCHSNCTYEDLLFIQLCRDQAPMHCNADFKKCTPPCSVLLCKTGSQSSCVTAIAPLNICCSYRCAETHQVSAALQNRLTVKSICYSL